MEAATVVAEGREAGEGAVQSLLAAARARPVAAAGRAGKAVAAAAAAAREVTVSMAAKAAERATGCLLCTLESLHPWPGNPTNAM